MRAVTIGFVDQAVAVVVDAVLHIGRVGIVVDKIVACGRKARGQHGVIELHTRVEHGDDDVFATGIIGREDAVDAQVFERLLIFLIAIAGAATPGSNRTRVGIHHFVTACVFVRANLQPDVLRIDRLGNTTIRLQYRRHKCGSTAQK